MKKYLPKSIVEKEGKKGSYITSYGAIGLGYLVNGYVYSSCGNGYYGIVDVKVFCKDNGKMYIDKVKSLGLFPGYNIV